MKGFIPIAEAAAQLGLTTQQVTDLANPGRLEPFYAAVAAAPAPADELPDLGFAVPPSFADIADAALTPFADGQFNLPPSVEE